MKRGVNITRSDLVRNTDRMIPSSDYFGIYKAFVKDNKDPLGDGRLKVLVPACHPLDASVLALPWAEACAMNAGPGRCALKLPKVGETIWVMFEHGDMHYPVWMGSWWGAPGGKKELPAEVSQDNYVLRTDNGNIINMSDTSGKVGIQISTPGGRSITLDDQNKNITISDGQVPENKIVIDNSANKLTLAASVSMDLEISGKSVKITGATNIPGIPPSITGCFSALPNCLFTGSPHLTSTVN